MDDMDNIKKKVLEALEMCNGIVTAACLSCDMPRSTFYLWLKNDPEFKEAVEDIQEIAIDFVESKLFEKINGVVVKGKGEYKEGEDPPVYEIPPSDTAIIFYLKTKAKKRGYIERTEVSGPNGNAIPIETKNIVEFRDYAETRDNPGVQSAIQAGIRN
jgi:hypothetical protein